MFDELLASIIQYTDETGRPVADPFKLLPSSEVWAIDLKYLLICNENNKSVYLKVYPEYYVHIKNPIDLRLICMKIMNGAYKSINQIEKDLLVMCKNAKTFNEPKSSIHQAIEFYNR